MTRIAPVRIVSKTKQMCLSATSDSSLTTASATREKEIQDSSMSEAELLNDTLQRATLTRAELMDDVEANPRVICVLRRRLMQQRSQVSTDRSWWIS